MSQLRDLLRNDKNGDNITVFCNLHKGDEFAGPIVRYLVMYSRVQVVPKRTASITRYVQLCKKDIIWWTRAGRDTELQVIARHD